MSLFETKNYKIIIGPSNLNEPDQKTDLYLIYNKSTNVCEAEHPIYPIAVEYTQQMQKHLDEVFENNGEGKVKLIN